MTQRRDAFLTIFSYKGYEDVNKNRKSVFNTLSAPSLKMKINRRVLQVQRPLNNNNYEPE